MNKDEILEFFSYLSNTQKNVLLKMIQEKPTLLEFFAENLKGKIKAFQFKDSQLWDKIIEKEKEFLERL